MPALRIVAHCGVLLGLLAACGSDSTGANPPNVVGTWNATKFEFVSIANPTTKLDAIAQGASATLLLTSAHGFTLTLNAPGQVQQVSTGTYVETATTLTVTVTTPPPTQTLGFDLVVSGVTMSLTGGTTTFDFGSGSTPAHINLTLTRQ